MFKKLVEMFKNWWKKEGKEKFVKEAKKKLDKIEKDY